jgi:neutral ceramidase
MRDAIKTELVQGGLLGEDGVVVIAGLSNAYADYTTTFEEFQGQRYEGGSTIFGPHQLDGYIQVLCTIHYTLCTIPYALY